MKSIAPIFLFVTIATTVGATFAVGSRGDEAPQEPHPVVAVNPQPVKTRVTVTSAQASPPQPAVKSGQSVIVSAPSAAFTGYYAPEPKQYLAVGSSVTGGTSGYGNALQASIYNYAGAPAASVVSNISGNHLAQGTTNTAASTATAQPATLEVSGKTSPSAETQHVTQSLTTNGSASETVSVTSSSGTTYANVSASQSSSGGSSAGSIFIDVETTP